MRLVNALQYFVPLRPGVTPQDLPEDFWAGYASGLVATPSCGRMEIGQDVVDAACEVIKSRPSTVLSAFHLARPPFPVTWLEWLMAPTAEIRRRGWLIVEQDSGTHRAILFGLESDNTLQVAGIGMVLRTETDPRGAISFSEAELKWLRPREWWKIEWPDGVISQAAAWGILPGSTESARRVGSSSDTDARSLKGSRLI